ncbi:hypothetical protein Tco_1048440 [Tanacetum coccineum]
MIRRAATRLQATPLSPAYVPDPMKLEHHVSVYFLEPAEDPIDYAADADDDEDEDEEHLAPIDSTIVASPPVPSAEETKPFETDKAAATPPPPPVYRTTSRLSVRSQALIPFPSEAEFARILALPTLPPSLLTPLSSPLP